MEFVYIWYKVMLIYINFKFNFLTEYMLKNANVLN
jgi:hypothetical protein